MALFGDAKLSFCIFIAFCCLTVTLADIPVDCCLAVGNVELQKQLFGDYHRQVAGQGCTLDAIILVTRRGRQLCAPADAPWVEEIVKHVEHLRKICRKLKVKSKRCTGVKLE